MFYAEASLFLDASSGTYVSRKSALASIASEVGPWGQRIYYDTSLILYVISTRILQKLAYLGRIYEYYVCILLGSDLQFEGSFSSKVSIQVGRSSLIWQNRVEGIVNEPLSRR